MKCCISFLWYYAKLTWWCETVWKNYLKRQPDFLDAPWEVHLVVSYCTNLSWKEKRLGIDKILWQMLFGQLPITLRHVFSLNHQLLFLISLKRNIGKKKKKKEIKEEIKSLKMDATAPQLWRFWEILWLVIWNRKQLDLLYTCQMFSPLLLQRYYISSY